MRNNGLAPSSMFAASMMPLGQGAVPMDAEASIDGSLANEPGPRLALIHSGRWPGPPPAASRRAWPMT
jgi:hypothetical protein